MDWEEEQVDIHMAAGSSLNMIPGGFKGLRLLMSTLLAQSGANRISLQRISTRWKIALRRPDVV